jgi:murein DD-endopeptidase MepM/ murein hydrolase activator NlpD
MSMQAFRSRYRVLSQAAAIALVAGLGAACSGDVTRFSKPVFKNPFSKTARAETPTPPEGVGYADSSPSYNRPGSGNSGVARYDLPPPPDYSAPRREEPRYEANRDYAMASPGNSGEGVTVRLGYGETLSSLSRRYNVSLSAIARANGITDPSRVNAGQRIYIPGASSASDDGGYAVARVDDSEFGRNSASRPGRTAPGPSVLGTLPATSDGRIMRDDGLRMSGDTHTVAYGESLGGIAGRYGISRAELMDANGITDPNRIREGQRLVIPGANMPDRRMASLDEPRGPVSRDVEPNYYEDNRYPEEMPTASVRRNQPAPAYEDREGPNAYTPPGSANSNMASLDPSDNGSANGQQFRWPVRGRIISGFGPKPNGERNDGINLAVPAGTSIKAAEAGTVIYSGNEIAGFGNLILVRHAGGWVTAYAHASEIAVRRGDQVRRGQTIGYAGATGSVNSPQLHFELRRGSNPVNPMDYLAGA